MQNLGASHLLVDEKATDKKVLSLQYLVTRAWAKGYKYVFNQH